MSYILLTVICLNVLESVICFLFPKGKRKITLNLRSVEKTNSVDKSFWNDAPTQNEFAREFSNIFLVGVVPFDVAVSKYTDDLEILKLQEDQHAALHTSTCVATLVSSRYYYVKKLLKIALMSTPAWFSKNILGNVETSFSNSVYFSQLVLGKFFCRMCVFHWMEEAEHSVLTSSHFKKDFNPVVRLLLYPIGCLALIALWVIPIPVAIICKPSMALSPQSYLNLVQYVLAVLVVAADIIIEGFLFWVLPFEHPHLYYRLVLGAWQKQVEEMGITFKTERQMDYYY